MGQVDYDEEKERVCVDELVVVRLASLVSRRGDVKVCEESGFVAHHQAPESSPTTTYLNMDKRTRNNKQVYEVEHHEVTVHVC